MGLFSSTSSLRATSAVIPSGSWSVSLWFKASSSPSNTLLFEHATTLDDHAVYPNSAPSSYPSITDAEIAWAKFTSAGELEVAVRVAPASSLGNYVKATTSGLSLATGSWYQLVIVCESGVSLRVYLNGTLVASASLSSSTLLGTTATPYSGDTPTYGGWHWLADYTGLRAFPGGMAEFGFFTAALASDDVTRLANGESALMVSIWPTLAYSCQSTDTSPPISTYSGYPGPHWDISFPPSISGDNPNTFEFGDQSLGLSYLRFPLNSWTSDTATITQSASAAVKLRGPNIYVYAASTLTLTSVFGQLRNFFLSTFWSHSIITTADKSWLRQLADYPPTASNYDKYRIQWYHPRDGRGNEHLAIVANTNFVDTTDQVCVWSPFYDAEHRRDDNDPANPKYNAGKIVNPTSYNKITVSFDLIPYSVVPYSVLVGSQPAVTGYNGSYEDIHLKNWFGISEPGVSHSTTSLTFNEGELVRELPPPGPIFYVRDKALASIVRSAVVSASSAIQLSPTSRQVRDTEPAATSSFTLTPVSHGGLEVSVYDVFASSAITLSFAVSQSSQHLYEAGAASTITLTGVIAGGLPKSVTASSVVTITPASTGRVPVASEALAFTQFQLATSSSGRTSSVRVSADSSFSLADDESYSGFFQYWVSGSSKFTFGTTYPTTSFLRSYERSSLTRVLFVAGVTLGQSRSYLATASVTAILTPASDVSDVDRSLPVAAASVLTLKPGAVVSGLPGFRAVSASTRLVVVTVGVFDQDSEFSVFAAGSLSLSASASESSEIVGSATDFLSLSDSTSSGRVFSVSATTTVSLSDPGESNDLLDVGGSIEIDFSDDASADVESLGAVQSIRFDTSANAAVVLPGGAIIPGGDSAAGLRYLLMDGISGDWPLSFAEASNGVLLAANGLDPMLRWNGLSQAATPAGLAAPSSALSLAGSGSGTITGRRVAFQRWMDSEGVVSNFSPIPTVVDFGRDGWIHGVSYNGSGTVTIRSDGHGLSTGDRITISGVLGDMEILNGSHAITVTDANHFTLDDVVMSSGSYPGGGSLSSGSSSVNYTNVVAPSDARVTRRQILRNLDGDAGTFYVDIDTTDLTSTSFTSSRTDADLAAQQAVPWSFDDESPAANRFDPPPSHKLALASHMGRIFAAGERPYTQGHVEVTTGSPLVRGVGTSWAASLAGRLLYVEGASRSYEVLSVVGDAQILVLAENYAGVSDRLARYAIRPSPSERRLVYFSEPNLPEAWPPWNAFSVPECSDEIVGLAVLKSFLYIIELRHIHRFTYKDDPARDGFVFQKVNRGCVNNRCLVVAENMAYMLDEAGLHVFDGEESRAISAPIQNLFQADAAAEYRIDWAADRTLWHASHDPVHETIRWFVTLVGKEPLTHAICYDYRKGRFWLESYAEPITSSCVGTAGYRRAICGTTIRRALVLGEGALDWLGSGTTETIGSLRGAVSAATDVTVQLAGGGLPSNLVGVPCQVVSGNGKGQTRLIVDSTDDTLTVLDPWDVQPEAGDTIQIGGIDWRWKSGWFRYADDEPENPRDLEVVFQPTASESMFNARLYYDHDISPRSWAYDQVRDNVSVSIGSPDIVVSTNVPRGYVFQRLSGHGDNYSYSDRYVSLELRGVQSEEPTRIFQVILNGVMS